MRKIAKPFCFILTAFILIVSFLAIFGIDSQFGDKRTVYIKGISDIRWGIDINGGLDVTFCAPDGVDATDSQMSAAESIINQRLVNLNITDSEVYVDYNKDRIVVRFPWKSDEKDFDPEKAIKEIGEMAEITFREGTATDSATGLPDAKYTDTLVIDGKSIESATPALNQEGKYVVSLILNDQGKQKFADSTQKMKNEKGYISIWMDDTFISAPYVNDVITDGKAEISGNFTADEAKNLADKINAGALPFQLKTEGFGTTSPSLGQGARNAMGIAALISFILIAVLMIYFYRLPGVVATITLFGQMAGTIIAISGFFPALPSFTLTIPGIAGMILSLGMGVDANIISAERIKEELNQGKTLDGSISIGFKKAFSAIFDGNITVAIVAIILMGAFGPTDSIVAKMFYWLFFMFGPATTGAVYSFGYTLMVGVLLNFLMGVLCSRIILKSISRFEFFRNPSFYGGAKK